MTTSRRGIPSWCAATMSRLTGRAGVPVTAGTTIDGTTSATTTVEAETAAAAPADRGDVPGWVLVTLMTAGLVSALWLVAGQALVNLFETAISHVAP